MITVAERRHLEDLIEAYGTATIDWAAKGGGEAPEKWRVSYRELRAYLDELTDYATYEARESDPTAPRAGDAE